MVKIGVKLKNGVGYLVWGAGYVTQKNEFYRRYIT